MSAPRREPTHFAYIDAVRGFAFLGVLFDHAAGCVGNFPGREFFIAGSYGVQLFFLASAITLCNSMAIRQSVDRKPVMAFYLRRLFRIAPLFWLAMVAYWVAPGLTMSDRWSGYLKPHPVEAWYFVATAFFMHGWWPYTLNRIVPGGWSIAVEMTFYAVFPLLFFYVNSLKRAAIAVAAGFAWTALETHALNVVHARWLSGIDENLFSFFQYFWFPSQVIVFLVGIFTFHFFRSAAGRALAERKSVMVPAGLLALGALVFFLPRGGAASQLIIVVAMAALIVVISEGKVPLVVNPAICYLGRISYSCYLTHFAALALALHLLGIHLTSQHAHHDAGTPTANALTFVTLLGVGLASTVIFSTVTMHLVENPGIELGRHCVARFHLGKKAAARAPRGVGLPDAPESAA